MTLKASDKPEFCPKWWTDQKPADVKGKDLEKSLECVEESLEATDDEEACEKEFDEAIAALKALEKVVKTTVSKECNAGKHKDVITVLEKYYKMIKEEIGELEEAKAECKEDAKGAKSSEEDDEDEDETKLFTKDYRYKKIKKVRQGDTSYNFAMGLNLDNPCETDFLLSNKKKPERLYQMVKKHKEEDGKRSYSDRCICCGTVYKDPENGKILVCKLGEGEKEPPRFFKTTRVLFRSDKKHLFKKTRLICGGSVIDDPEPLTAADGDDAEAEAGAGAGATPELEQRRRAAATAAQIWTQARDTAADQISQLQSKLDMFDDADAKSVREKLATLLDRYPKLDFTALARAATKEAFDQSLATTRTGLVEWARLVGSDPALNTIDKNPFVTTNVRGTYTDALRNISTALKA